MADKQPKPSDWMQAAAEEINSWLDEDKLVSPDCEQVAAIIAKHASKPSDAAMEVAKTVAEEFDSYGYKLEDHEGEISKQQTGAGLVDAIAALIQPAIDAAVRAERNHYRASAREIEETLLEHARHGKEPQFLVRDFRALLLRAIEEPPPEPAKFNAGTTEEEAEARRIEEAHRGISGLGEFEPCQHADTHWRINPFDKHAPVEVCNDCGKSRCHDGMGGDSGWMMVFVSEFPLAGEPEGGDA